jgi:hypothetical protein
MGSFVALDGRTFSLRTARIERAEVEELIESGCPVVTYLPGGRLQWHDEEDAWPAWADARSAPDDVTAGRWESPDGSTAVVLVWPPPPERGSRAVPRSRGRGRPRRGGR